MRLLVLPIFLITKVSAISLQHGPGALHLRQQLNRKPISLVETHLNANSPTSTISDYGTSSESESDNSISHFATCTQYPLLLKANNRLQQTDVVIRDQTSKLTDLNDRSNSVKTVLLSMNDNESKLLQEEARLKELKRRLDSMSQDHGVPYVRSSDSAYANSKDDLAVALDRIQNVQQETSLRQQYLDQEKNNDEVHAISQLKRSLQRLNYDQSENENGEEGKPLNELSQQEQVELKNSVDAAIDALDTTEFRAGQHREQNANTQIQNQQYTSFLQVNLKTSTSDTLDAQALLAEYRANLNARLQNFRQDLVNESQNKQQQIVQVNSRLSQLQAQLGSVRLNSKEEQDELQKILLSMKLKQEKFSHNSNSQTSQDNRELALLNSRLQQLGKLPLQRAQKSLELTVLNHKSNNLLQVINNLSKAKQDLQVDFNTLKRSCNQQINHDRERKNEIESEGKIVKNLVSLLSSEEDQNQVEVMRLERSLGVLEGKLSEKKKVLQECAEVGMGEKMRGVRQSPATGQSQMDDSETGLISLAADSHKELQGQILLQKKRNLMSVVKEQEANVKRIAGLHGLLDVLTKDEKHEKAKHNHQHQIPAGMISLLQTSMDSQSQSSASWLATAASDIDEELAEAAVSPRQEQLVQKQKEIESLSSELNLSSSMSSSKLGPHQALALNQLESQMLPASSFSDSISTSEVTVPEDHALKLQLQALTNQQNSLHKSEELSDEKVKRMESEVVNSQKREQSLRLQLEELRKKRDQEDGKDSISLGSRLGLSQDSKTELPKAHHPTPSFDEQKVMLMERLKTATDQPTLEQVKESIRNLGSESGESLNTESNKVTVPNHHKVPAKKPSHIKPAHPPTTGAKKSQLLSKALQESELQRRALESKLHDLEEKASIPSATVTETDSETEESNLGIPSTVTQDLHRKSNSLSTTTSTSDSTSTPLTSGLPSVQALLSDLKKQESTLRNEQDRLKYEKEKVKYAESAMISETQRQRQELDSFRSSELKRLQAQKGQMRELEDQIVKKGLSLEKKSDLVDLSRKETDILRSQAQQFKEAEQNLLIKVKQGAERVSKLETEHEAIKSEVQKQKEASQANLESSKLVKSRAKKMLSQAWEDLERAEKAHARIEEERKLLRKEVENEVQREKQTNWKLDQREDGIRKFGKNLKSYALKLKSQKFLIEESQKEVFSARQSIITQRESLEKEKKDLESREKLLSKSVEDRVQEKLNSKIKQVEDDLKQQKQSFDKDLEKEKQSLQDQRKQLRERESKLTERETELKRHEQEVNRHESEVGFHEDKVKRAEELAKIAEEKLGTRWKEFDRLRKEPLASRLSSKDAQVQQDVSVEESSEKPQTKTTKAVHKSEAATDLNSNHIENSNPAKPTFSDLDKTIQEVTQGPPKPSPTSQLSSQLDQLHKNGSKLNDHLQQLESHLSQDSKKDSQQIEKMIHDLQVVKTESELSAAQAAAAAAAKAKVNQEFRERMEAKKAAAAAKRAKETPVSVGRDFAREIEEGEAQDSKLAKAAAEVLTESHKADSDSDESECANSKAGCPPEKKIEEADEEIKDIADSEDSSKTEKPKESAATSTASLAETAKEIQDIEETPVTEPKSKSEVTEQEETAKSTVPTKEKESDSWSPEENLIENTVGVMESRSDKDSESKLKAMSESEKSQVTVQAAEKAEHSNTEHTAASEPVVTKTARATVTEATHKPSPDKAAVEKALKHILHDLDSKLSLLQLQAPKAEVEHSKDHATSATSFLQIEEKPHPRPTEHDNIEALLDVDHHFSKPKEPTKSKLQPTKAAQPPFLSELSALEKEVHETLSKYHADIAEASEKPVKSKSAEKPAKSKGVPQTKKSQTLSIDINEITSDSDKTKTQSASSSSSKATKVKPNEKPAKSKKLPPSTSHKSSKSSHLTTTATTQKVKQHTQKPHKTPFTGTSTSQSQTHSQTSQSESQQIASLRHDLASQDSHIKLLEEVLRKLILLNRQSSLDIGLEITSTVQDVCKVLNRLFKAPGTNNAIVTAPSSWNITFDGPNKHADQELKGMIAGACVAGLTDASNKLTVLTDTAGELTKKLDDEFGAVTAAPGPAPQSAMGLKDSVAAVKSKKPEGRADAVAAQTAAAKPKEEVKEHKSQTSKKTLKSKNSSPNIQSKSIDELISEADQLIQANKKRLEDVKTYTKTDVKSEAKTDVKTDKAVTAKTATAKTSNGRSNSGTSKTKPKSAGSHSKAKAQKVTKPQTENRNVALAALAHTSFIQLNKGNSSSEATTNSISTSDSTTDTNPPLDPKLKAKFDNQILLSINQKLYDHVTDQLQQIQKQILQLSFDSNCSGTLHQFKQRYDLDQQGMKNNMSKLHTSVWETLAQGDQDTENMRGAVDKLREVVKSLAKDVKESGATLVNGGDKGPMLSVTSTSSSNTTTNTYNLLEVARDSTDSDDTQQVLTENIKSYINNQVKSSFEGTIYHHLTDQLSDIKHQLFVLKFDSDCSGTLDEFKKEYEKDHKWFEKNISTLESSVKSTLKGALLGDKSEASQFKKSVTDLTKLIQDLEKDIKKGSSSASAALVSSDSSEKTPVKSLTSNLLEVDRGSESTSTADDIDELSDTKPLSKQIKDYIEQQVQFQLTSSIYKQLESQLQDVQKQIRVHLGYSDKDKPCDSPLSKFKAKYDKEQQALQDKMSKLQTSTWEKLAKGDQDAESMKTSLSKLNVLVENLENDVIGASGGKKLYSSGSGKAVVLNGPLLLSTQDQLQKPKPSKPSISNHTLSLTTQLKDLLLRTGALDTSAQRLQRWQDREDNQIAGSGGSLGGPNIAYGLKFSLGPGTNGENEFGFIKTGTNVFLPQFHDPRRLLHKWKYRSAFGNSNPEDGSGGRLMSGDGDYHEEEKVDCIMGRCFNGTERNVTVDNTGTGVAPAGPQGFDAGGYLPGVSLGFDAGGYLPGIPDPNADKTSFATYNDYKLARFNASDPTGSGGSVPSRRPPPEKNTQPETIGDVDMTPGEMMRQWDTEADTKVKTQGGGSGGKNDQSQLTMKRQSKSQSGKTAKSKANSLMETSHTESSQQTQSTEATVAAVKARVEAQIKASNTNRDLINTLRDRIREMNISLLMRQIAVTKEQVKELKDSKPSKADESHKDNHDAKVDKLAPLSASISFLQMDITPILRHDIHDNVSKGSGGTKKSNDTKTTTTSSTHSLLQTGSVKTVTTVHHSKQRQTQPERYKMTKSQSVSAISSGSESDTSTRASDSDSEKSEDSEQEKHVPVDVDVSDAAIERLKKQLSDDEDEELREAGIATVSSAIESDSSDKVNLELESESRTKTSEPESSKPKPRIALPENPDKPLFKNKFISVKSMHEYEADQEVENAENLKKAIDLQFNNKHTESESSSSSLSSESKKIKMSKSEAKPSVSVSSEADSSTRSFSLARMAHNSLSEPSESEADPAPGTLSSLALIQLDGRAHKKSKHDDFLSQTHTHPEESPTDDQVTNTILHSRRKHAPRDIKGNPLDLFSPKSDSEFHEKLRSITQNFNGYNSQKQRFEDYDEEVQEGIRRRLGHKGKGHKGHHDHSTSDSLSSESSHSEDHHEVHPSRVGHALDMVVSHRNTVLDKVRENLHSQVEQKLDILLNELKYAEDKRQGRRGRENKIYSSEGDEKENSSFGDTEPNMQLTDQELDELESKRTKMHVRHPKPRHVSLPKLEEELSEEMVSERLRKGLGEVNSIGDRLPDMDHVQHYKARKVAEHLTDDDLTTEEEAAASEPSEVSDLEDLKSKYHLNNGILQRASGQARGAAAANHAEDILSVPQPEERDPFYTNSPESEEVKFSEGRGGEKKKSSITKLIQKASKTDPDAKKQTESELSKKMQKLAKDRKHSIEIEDEIKVKLAENKIKMSQKKSDKAEKADGSNSYSLEEKLNSHTKLAKDKLKLMELALKDRLSNLNLSLAVEKHEEKNKDSEHKARKGQTPKGTTASVLFSTNTKALNDDFNRVSSLLSQVKAAESQAKIQVEKLKDMKDLTLKHESQPASTNGKTDKEDLEENLGVQSALDDTVVKARVNEVSKPQTTSSSSTTKSEAKPSTATASSDFDKELAQFRKSLDALKELDKELNLNTKLSDSKNDNIPHDHDEPSEESEPKTPEDNQPNSNTDASTVSKSKHQYGSGMQDEVTKLDNEIASMVQANMNDEAGLSQKSKKIKEMREAQQVRENQIKAQRKAQMEQERQQQLVRQQTQQAQQRENMRRMQVQAQQNQAQKPNTNSVSFLSGVSNWFSSAFHKIGDSLAVPTSFIQLSANNTKTDSTIKGKAAAQSTSDSSSKAKKADVVQTVTDKDGNLYKLTKVDSNTQASDLSTDHLTSELTDDSLTSSLTSDPQASEGNLNLRNTQVENDPVLTAAMNEQRKLHGTSTDAQTSDSESDSLSSTNAVQQANIALLEQQRLDQREMEERKQELKRREDREKRLLMLGREEREDLEFDENIQEKEEMLGLGKSSISTRRSKTLTPMVTHKLYSSIQKQHNENLKSPNPLLVSHDNTYFGADERAFGVESTQTNEGRNGFPGKSKTSSESDQVSDFSDSDTTAFWSSTKNRKEPSDTYIWGVLNSNGNSGASSESVGQESEVLSSLFDKTDAEMNLAHRSSKSFAKPRQSRKTSNNNISLMQLSQKSNSKRANLDIQHANKHNVRTWDEEVFALRERFDQLDRELASTDESLKKELFVSSSAKTNSTSMTNSSSNVNTTSPSTSFLQTSVSKFSPRHHRFTNHLGQPSNSEANQKNEKSNHSQAHKDRSSNPWMSALRDVLVDMDKIDSQLPRHVDVDFPYLFSSSASSASASSLLQLSAVGKKGQLFSESDAVDTGVSSNSKGQTILEKDGQGYDSYQEANRRAESGSGSQSESKQVPSGPTGGSTLDRIKNWVSSIDLKNLQPQAGQAVSLAQLETSSKNKENSKKSITFLLSSLLQKFENKRRALEKTRLEYERELAQTTNAANTNTKFAFNQIQSKQTQSQSQVPCTSSGLESVKADSRDLEIEIGRLASKLEVLKTKKDRSINVESLREALKV